MSRSVLTSIGSVSPGTSAATSWRGFWERVDPALRLELIELARRRGMAARRIAERVAPIEIVLDDPRRGRQRMIGRVQPPQLCCGELREIEFGLSELDPAQ